MKLRFVILSACLCLFASLTWADTLELKNGSVIKGIFVGGNENEVAFRVGASTQRYPVSDIVSLKFEPESAAPATAEAAPAPEQPAPAAQMTADGSPARLYAPDSKTVTVPSGTHLVVRTVDSIDSDKNQIGDRFQATLDQALYVNELLVAPRGTSLYGRLEEVKSAGQFAGKSQLRLALTGIVLDGRTYALVSGDYELSGKSRGASTAKRVGGATAVGAVIGAIVGGGKGAAVGAGVGAGAGTAVQIATKGEQVHVPSETLLDFTLEQPLTVTLAAK